MNRVGGGCSLSWAKIDSISSNYLTHSFKSVINDNNSLSKTVEFLFIKLVIVLEELLMFYS